MAGAGTSERARVQRAAAGRTRAPARELPAPRATRGDVLPTERLLASWRRSEDYGVPLEDVEPAFAGSFDDASLFFECGQAILTELHATLVNEPISLMLTDADGLVLNRLSGDTSLLRALDAVHLAPGFAYSERHAGTNGLGLALADRVPTVVHADEHYALTLRGYTCAAVPVRDPVTGRVEGCVNVTTRSTSSSDLLLALAQSAASSTSALMLARSGGHHPRPTPRGRVFRVTTEPRSGTLADLSPAWTGAVGDASAALALGRVVVALGEQGSGRSTLLAQAHRRVRPGDRILSARAPAPRDADPWLGLWAPEVGKAHTAVVVADVDELSMHTAEEVREVVVRARAAHSLTVVDPAGGVAFSLTARRWEDIPAPLAGLVDAVVAVPPLRERPDDVVPLARHAARRVRGREVELTPAAERALRDCGWPGNVDQLDRVVRDAATRTDRIDVRHLPSEVLSGTGRRLSRIEAFEREEIVRVLTRPGIAMRDAAEELGMSRATVYRKVAQYGLHIPRQ